MLEDSEFKPFNLTDFMVAETLPEDSESSPEQPARESKSTAWLGILGAAALVVATAIWMAVKS